VEGIMKRPSKEPSKLSDSVHHQLSMYALAASAAGLGVLALPQPAAAKIIYTKTHRAIQGCDQRLNLDLNHDGHADFRFYIGLCHSWLGFVGI
jgi:hypothetical protein